MLRPGIRLFTVIAYLIVAYCSNDRANFLTPELPAIICNMNGTACDIIEKIFRCLFQRFCQQISHFNAGLAQYVIGSGACSLWSSYTNTQPVKIIPAAKLNDVTQAVMTTMPALCAIA